MRNSFRINLHISFGGYLRGSVAGHFNHDVIQALNDAVVKVFWTKKDLRRLLDIAGVDQRLINAQDWQNYKYHIVSPIIDQLNIAEDGLGPLRRILQETLRYKACKIGRASCRERV